METSMVEKNVTTLLEDADILRVKGSAEEAQQKIHEALALMESASADDEEAVEKKVIALNKMTELNKLMGRWKEAMSDLEKIIGFSGRVKNRSEIVKSRIHEGELLSYFGEYAESINSFEAALDMAKETGIPEETALCKLFLGTINAKIGEHQKGKELIEECIELIKDRQDSVEARNIMASALSQIGLQYFRKGKFEDAIAQYEKAITILEDRHDSLEKAEAYRYIGVIHSIKSNYREALSYHQKSLQIVGTVKYLFGMAKVYNSIGQLCLDVQKLDEALFFMEKAERICHDLGADAEAATIYGKLGNVYMQKEDFENAVKFHLKDMEMCKRFGNYRALAYTYRNLGLSYLHNNQGEEAVSYLKEGLDRFLELQDTVNVGRIYIDLCQDCLNKDDLVEAEKMGKASLEALEKYPQSPDTAYARTLCGVIARRKKDYDGAYKYFTESMEILGWKEPSTKLIETHHELGVLYLEMKDLKKALVNFKIALRTARDMGLKKQVEKNLRIVEKIDEMEIVNIILEEL
jgi:tetratricopeptide (TPR) repeat protein